MQILFILNLACYIASVGLAFSNVIKPGNPSGPDNRGTTHNPLVLGSVLLHAIILYLTNLHEGEINLSLGRTLSMSAWMSLALYLVASQFNHTLRLNIIMIPIGLLGLITGYLTPGTPFLLSQFSQGEPSQHVIWHIVLAIPAYGILCIAFAQAVLLYAQEKQLHKPNPLSHLTFLPAIQTMESNLFWLTSTGFFLLTLNLVFGGFSSWYYYGKLFVFNHHIVLSVVSWLCFGFLLLGRKHFGWRGEHAAKWTMISFFILALGYFGTRFVKNIILDA